MARVKVLLIDDVPNLGLAGEVYTVAGGYARNYLMPRGMAIIASKGAMKQAEEIRQAGIRRRAQMRAGAEAQAQVISGKRLIFEANAGDKLDEQAALVAHHYEQAGEILTAARWHRRLL